jgi:hypothetical protein
MLGALQARLTYANLMSTLAVCLALTGGIAVSGVRVPPPAWQVT